MANKAKDRAEELFHRLQKKARELMEAEDGVTKTVRDLIEDNGLAPAEVKKRLDDMMGKIKANNLWERVRNIDAKGAFTDARGEVERRVEETVQRLMTSLPIATRNDLKELEAEIAALKRRVDALKKQSAKSGTSDANA